MGWRVVATGVSRGGEDILRSFSSPGCNVCSQVFSCTQLSSFRSKEQIQCFPLPPEGSCTWSAQPPWVEANACCTRGDADCVIADDGTRTTPTEFILLRILLPKMTQSTTASDVLAVGFGYSHSCCITCDGCLPFETMIFLVRSPQTRT